MEFKCQEKRHALEVKYNMEYGNLRIGVDVDGTLTYEKLPTEGSLEQTREFIRNVKPRKGIEILQILCVNPLVITGRGTYFDYDTSYWLDKVNVKYTKLFTVDRTKSLSFQQYIDYKVNVYVQNNVEYCIEDDIRVINALEKEGIICSLVKGNESFETAFFRLFE